MAEVLGHSGRASFCRWLGGTGDSPTSTRQAIAPAAGRPRAFELVPTLSLLVGCVIVALLIAVHAARPSV